MTWQRLTVEIWVKLLSSKEAHIFCNAHLRFICLLVSLTCCCVTQFKTEKMKYSFQASASTWNHVHIMEGWRQVYQNVLHEIPGKLCIKCQCLNSVLLINLYLTFWNLTTTKVTPNNTLSVPNNVKRFEIIWLSYGTGRQSRVRAVRGEGILSLISRSKNWQLL